MLRAAYQPATAERSRPRDRAVAATVALALQAGLIYALIAGLAVGVPPTLRDDLKIFGVALPPPPPPPEPPKPREKVHQKKEGAASPANLRAKPTEIVAPPPPPIVKPVPPPVVAAPIAGVGVQNSAGAAPVRGPGTGAGGVGNGTGSGGAGDGEGDGDGTDPYLRSGRIKDSDYPESVRNTDISARVFTLYTVGVNGRVTKCVVTKSSGNPDIDAVPCRIMMQRFRYEPSRDAQGRPIPAEVEGVHEWVSHRAPDPD